MNLEPTAQSILPTAHGLFTLTVYRSSCAPRSLHSSRSLDVPTEDLLILSKGTLPTSTSPQHPYFVRLHSACFTGEALGSLRCDCKAQLDQAMQHIQNIGQGAILYLAQEGRGIGLTSKIQAYALQDQGMDTIQANEALGLPIDSRSFHQAALLLKHLGIQHINLNTNNPLKVSAMTQAGLHITALVPSHTEVTEYNKHYLTTKRDLMGHLL